jgi:heme exporter protein A
MLTVDHFTHERDDRVVLDDINFTLTAGEGLLITGANGSGKTTLLRALVGLIEPLRGQVRFDGRPIAERYRDVVYLSHLPGLKSMLSAEQNLQLFHRIYPCHQSVEAALAQVGLAGYASVPVRQMSAGQQRRVALARLCMQQAALWLLDEPLTALDSSGVTLIQQLVQAHCAAGGMVVITSHQPVHFARFTWQGLVL